MAEPWAPTLSDVARHIPRRTRDTKTPGSDALLGTFTASTTPTAEQAQAVIDNAVGVLLATFGALATASDDVLTAVRSAVEWRTAADIEIAYPNRDADVQVYDQLNARAQAEWQQLTVILTEAEESITAAEPAYQFPCPPPWGDLSPGSGVEALPTSYGARWRGGAREWPL